MHIKGISAFSFRTPEQRVKGVDFDICQNAPKLIGYHNNVPWTTTKLVSFVIPIHVTTSADKLKKIGLVVADEWTTIVKLKPSCSAISIC